MANRLRDRPACISVFGVRDGEQKLPVISVSQLGDGESGRLRRGKSMTGGG